MKRLTKTLPHDSIDLASFFNRGVKYPLMGILTDKTYDGTNKFILSVSTYEDPAKLVCWTNGTSCWATSKDLRDLVAKTLNNSHVLGMFVFDNFHELIAWLQE